MHHISEVVVKNFKSITWGRFPLSLYTPMVGYNNAGKTNILRAIAWAIKRSSLASEDFHNVDLPVTVEVAISGITDEVLDVIGNTHRGRVEPLIEDGCIRIRRTQVAPGQSVTAIALEVYKPENGQDNWVVNPTGIDAAIGALFPEPIFIGAMENATEDVTKFGTGTTIGKLLREIMSPVIERHTPAVAAALQAVAGRLEANATDKDETLVDLDGRIQSELSRFFPGVSAKIHIPVPDFADFIKSATIRIFEDGYENPVGRDASSFGHGAQRSIQIALIKCLAEVRRSGGANAGRTTLLLIDEPELYLHPQAIEVVRSALSQLAGSGYQVILTTHSANMIARLDAPNVLMIRRNAPLGTTCYPRIKDAVRAAINGALYQSETLFALSNSNKILFSERVVITEGKTERALLPAIYQNTFFATPGEEKIGLVDIGGTSNIPDAMKVLHSMGLPCKAVVDLDFAFKIAPSKGLISSENVDLAVCKTVLVQLKEQGRVELDEGGFPKKSASGSAAAGFELLAKQTEAIPCIARLHEELKTVGIWMWTKGAIEAHLGIDKTTASQMAFIESLEDEAFKAGAPDYQTVKDAMVWLRN